MDPILVLFSLIVVGFFKKNVRMIILYYFVLSERSSGEADYSIFFSMIKIRGCIFLKVTLFPIHVHVRSHFIHHGTRKIIRYRGK